MKLRISLLIVVTGGLGLGAPLSVCDVRAGLFRLDGSDISVRGIWTHGDSGDTLRAPAACELPTVISGWRFFDGIDVIPDGGKAGVASYIAQYRDLKRSSKTDVKVFATLQGRVETRANFQLWADGFGNQWPEVFRQFFVVRLRLVHASDLRAVPYELGEAESELRKGWGNPLPKRVE